MAGDGHRAGTASGHAFDLATAVRGGPERWTAEVDAGWTVADRPNGGYLLALVARAAVEAAGLPHPLAVSAHFLSPADPGPVELETHRLRAGRSLSTTRVTLLQEGQTRLEALVTAGRIDPGAAPGWQRAGGPAGLAPPQDCIPGRPEMPGRPAGQPARAPGPSTRPGHRRLDRRPPGRAPGHARLGPVLRRPTRWPCSRWSTRSPRAASSWACPAGRPRSS